MLASLPSSACRVGLAVSEAIRLQRPYLVLARTAGPEFAERWRLVICSRVRCRVVRCCYLPLCGRPQMVSESRDGVTFLLPAY